MGAIGGALAGGLVGGGIHLIGGGEFGKDFADAFSAGSQAGAIIGATVGSAIGAYHGGMAGAKAGAVRPAGTDLYAGATPADSDIVAGVGEAKRQAACINTAAASTLVAGASSVAVAIRFLYFVPNPITYGTATIGTILATGATALAGAWACK